MTDQKNQSDIPSFADSFGKTVDRNVLGLPKGWEDPARVFLSEATRSILLDPSPENGAAWKKKAVERRIPMISVVVEEIDALVESARKNGFAGLRD